MAISNTSKKTTVKEEKANTTEWKHLAIPDSKFCGLYTNKETGKVSLSFEIADTSECNGRFYVSAKCVRRNDDRTGFIVSMPQGEVTIYSSIKEGNEWKKETFKADKLVDLGYPFVD